MDTDSSTPKFKTAAKKVLSGIINGDLHFSPTGIKNVLISSKIKKKKLSRLSNLGPFFLEVVVEKTRKEKKILQRITEVFHFQYVRDWNYNKYRNKTQMIVQFREPCFIALCYYEILPGKNWHFCRTIRCSTFSHDLRERTKKGEVIPIIRLWVYQDGDSS